MLVSINFSRRNSSNDTEISPHLRTRCHWSLKSSPMMRCCNISWINKSIALLDNLSPHLFPSWYLPRGYIGRITPNKHRDKPEAYTVLKFSFLRQYLWPSMSSFFIRVWLPVSIDSHHVTLEARASCWSGIKKDARWRSSLNTSVKMTSRTKNSNESLTHSHW